MGINTLVSDTLLFNGDVTRLRSKNPAIDQKEARQSMAEFPEHLTILNLIDQGGVGRIHLIYDEMIGRRVAVKELLDEFTLNDAANSFIHEAKIIGKIGHPDIVPVCELDWRNSGQAYYVMRYVKGETLEQSLK